MLTVRQGLKKTPLKVDGRFVEVEWDEAIKFSLRKDYREYGGSEFAAVASAKCTNEENYLLQKFTRAVIGSETLTTVQGYATHHPLGLKMSLGSGDLPPNSIDELGMLQCILAVSRTNSCRDPPHNPDTGSLRPVRGGGFQGSGDRSKNNKAL